MTDTPNVVTMRGIVKRFPGVLASDHVDFDLRRGEIHALLGENGAGKSTLMNILAGLYRADAGAIEVHGKAVQFGSPRQAIQAGIGMIHQHFMLVPSQSVTENILLGLTHPRFWLRLAENERVVSELGERFGLKVDPKAKIWQLSVGEQQRVEILKMLYRGADVLILDEPTAVLGPQETEQLFKTLRNMTQQGKSIIFISHKLNEVMSIADRVTVMRRGRVTAADVATKGSTTAELARLMVGRDVLFRVHREAQEPGPVVLQIEDLHADNDRGVPALRGLSLEVRAGEIVGLAGVAGNGQRELSEVITGLRRAKSGRVRLNGENLTNQPVRKAIERGLAHVPEDRNKVGSSPNLSLTDNLIMKQYAEEPIGRGWRLDAGEAAAFANRLKHSYEISAPSVETQARLLSGGNLQRLILAREISTKPKAMIAMQPTQGLDVGAVEVVHNLLLEQRKQGVAILLVSEELEELLSLSDRIAVIYEGTIVGDVESGDVEWIGQLMTGSSGAL
ncbi:MAG TPA: ABC transporter ATP-binding protein [Kouleothrix sp.]|uniref:ABC transporter ATP-binding protein n=1 Tax=Kouleothrix sp. TaxID=2779161 RepID=UPI002BCC3B5E|nr:ABC transporter ATP-binding protein [Kouleothrix sp.]HRC75128.1 ABC transporter ATP-binding protein [Kouleothrix sp.]